MGQGPVHGHEPDVPFFAIGELVRDAAGVTDAWSEADLRDLVERLGQGWQPPTRHYLAFALGLDTPELEAQNGAQLTAGMGDVVDLLLAEASARPILVVEDIHWLDSASAAVLRRLVERNTTSATLLTTERPGYGHPLEGWTDAATVVAAALSGAAAVELAAEASGSMTLAPDVASAIEARSGGNALFVEELARSYVEAGWVDAATGDMMDGVAVNDLPAPGSISEVILSRCVR